MTKLKTKDRKGLRVWVEIDTKAAKQNFEILKKIISPEVLFGAVTKSNAYGHGLIQYSQLMEKFGADWICVDSVLEARALREHGIKIPILVMGYTLPENFVLAQRLRISVTVSTFENLKRALKIKGLKLHLKFDTGMTRQGFLLKDLPAVKKMVKSQPKTVEGVYTHFAKAKVPRERDETDKQLGEFKIIIDELKKSGLKFLVHAAGTSGVIVYKNSHFDLVRFGIGIYGLWPEKAVREEYEKDFQLKPALSWKSLISEVKAVPKGRKVGYDHTHELARNSVIAICPVGYWHGYMRRLSNKSSVLIKGQRAKLLGRVSMGMIVLDVTDIKGVKVGDEVVLLGKQGEDEITATELGDLAGTFNYEIVTGINPYSKRFYL